MTKPCGRATHLGACHYPRAKGKQRCLWHILLSQDAMTQQRAAVARKMRAVGSDLDVSKLRARVPEAQWPARERWCSGCQSFVPLFYCSGSRCEACASSAAHAAKIEKAYGITGDEYGALFRLQGGRCYICQRKSPSRRLAVDHDHLSGVVRGLLCPDPDRGCNHAILGPLEASPGGALAAAKRMVDYLEDPPYARLQRGERRSSIVMQGPPPLDAMPPPF